MITKEMLRTLCPGAKEHIIEGVAKYFNQYASDYGITTPLRIAHFFAQAAHESASFMTLEEYASGAAYEGRRDLGNIHKGDGRRFKGRGIFQLTGRANYTKFGSILGLDLVGNPELAEHPETSVRTALEYWKSRNININADKDDIVGATKKINGGRNGLQDRKNYLRKAKEIYDILQVQNKLVELGYDIVADGRIGRRTTQAIEDFQSKNNLKPDGVAGPKTRAVLFTK
jgi:putative chitinase